MNKILDQLSEVRRERGVKQAELGDKLGMPQSHISKVLRGGADPRLSTVMDMAKILDHELMLIPREMILRIRAILEGEDDNRPRFELRGEEEESD
ncbi:MAG: helix-turn-helix transcriptional regulator [Rickettsiaceae bacterium]|nr:helix-turn-helix transcriptional regulator [Rickettsiaceae bacterium]